MSIVAYDGSYLATDRMATNADMVSQCLKSRMVRGAVIAWTGDTASGLMMAEWYQHGSVGAFPSCQTDSNRWSRLIVANLRSVVVYEQEPCAIPVLEKFMAWGSGRDFAMGAMAMGASAKQAVEIASQFSASCGLGVDVYDLTTLKKITE